MIKMCFNHNFSLIFKFYYKYNVVYAKYCYLKILTDKQVKDFLFLNLDECFNRIEKIILI